MSSRMILLCVLNSMFAYLSYCCIKVVFLWSYLIKRLKQLSFFDLDLSYLDVHFLVSSDLVFLQNWSSAVLIFWNISYIVVLKWLVLKNSYVVALLHCWSFVLVMVFDFVNIISIESYEWIVVQNLPKFIPWMKEMCLMSSQQLN